MIRLFTKTDYFFDYFEQSSQNIVEAADLFNQMMQDVAKADSLHRKIKEIEHQNDKITHESFKRLDSAFITPVDREDIHALTSKLDDVLDFIDSSATRFVIYRVGMTTPGLKSLAEILHKSAVKLDSAIGKFRNFKKLKPALLKELVEINTLENEGDEALRKAMADLFENEKDPIKLIKIKDIYEYIETAIDCCEDVSNVIETVILKHS